MGPGNGPPSGPPNPGPMAPQSPRMMMRPQQMQGPGAHPVILRANSPATPGTIQDTLPPPGSMYSGAPGGSGAKPPTASGPPGPPTSREAPPGGPPGPHPAQRPPSGYPGPYGGPPGPRPPG